MVMMGRSSNTASRMIKTGYPVEILMFVPSTNDQWNNCYGPTPSDVVVRLGLEPA